MRPTGDHTAAVLTLLLQELAEPDDGPDLVGRLQRLCRTARRDLRVWGVGVSVVLESGDQVTVAASDPASALVGDLQFAMGEGPCLAAFASHVPVLVPDLSEAASTTWLGYGPAAYDYGVRAVFAFPLQVGRARLGALNVYRDEPGSLSAWALSRALTYAEVAMKTMLEAQQAAGESASLLSDGDDIRFEVFQAQGMVMVQFGVGAAEALSRMRGYAFANDRRLRDVASDIVGRLRAANGALPDRDEDGLGFGPIPREDIVVAAAHLDPRLLLSPVEVGALLHLDPRAVIGWAKAGQLRSVSTSSGQWFFLRADILAMSPEPRQELPMMPTVSRKHEARPRPIPKQVDSTVGADRAVGSPSAESVAAAAVVAEAVVIAAEADAAMAQDAIEVAAVEVLAAAARAAGAAKRAREARAAAAALAAASVALAAKQAARVNKPGPVLHRIW